MAKFRAIFGDENKTLIRNLDITAIEGDQASTTATTPCKQLQVTIEALDKGFRTHRNVLYIVSTRQLLTEITKDFYNRLAEQVKKCNFGDAPKIVLGGILVLGTRFIKA